MRIRSALFCFLSLLPGCLLLPAAAHAQFQEPTKEELAMTSDPKAPGAAAVYLFYEEKTDDPLHYHSVRARIKVLTEKGKALATVNVPYWRGEQKVTDIHARTIHADGTVVPLEGKPEDLLQMKAGEVQIGRRVFNLPGVEVGSILEYEYQIRYDDNQYSSPYWEIQKPYFVHKAHYYFVPFKAFQKGADAVTSHYLIDEHGNPVNTLMWWQQLPTGAKVVQDAQGKFTLDIEEIPAVPDEDYMPPMNAVLYQLLFYYKSAMTVADFWKEEAKRWSKEVDHFAEPTGAIKDAAAKIVAPGDSDLVKAQKLYKAVQALDNTDYSRTKGKAELKAMGLKPAKRAEDTWAQKSGSGQDITLLYLALLRASGLTAYGMKVVNRDRGIFQANYLNFKQLDDELVILVADGKEIYLDPGEKMCPFQLIRWTHQDASGVRESASGQALSTVPLLPYKTNSITRIGDVMLDANGAITGGFRVVMAGQEAVHWRQMALEQDDEEVKKRFDRTLEGIVPEGVEAHVDHFLGMDDEDSNLLAVVKMNGTLGTSMGKRLVLPGYFFESRARQPFVAQTARLTPIDMHYGSVTVEQITYHLPAGLQVEGAPKDNQLGWSPNANLIYKSVQAPGQITVARAFGRAFTLLKADEYQDLRGFYEKVAASDQQQMVLTAAAK